MAETDISHNLFQRRMNSISFIRPPKIFQQQCFRLVLNSQTITQTTHLFPEPERTQSWTFSPRRTPAPNLLVLWFWRDLSGRPHEWCFCWAVARPTSGSGHLAGKMARALQRRNAPLWVEWVPVCHCQKTQSWETYRSVNTPVPRWAQHPVRSPSTLLEIRKQQGHEMDMSLIKVGKLLLFL